MKSSIIDNHRYQRFISIVVFTAVAILLSINSSVAAKAEKSIDTRLEVAAHKWTGIRLKNIREGTSLQIRLTIDGPTEVFLLDSVQYSRFPALADTPLFHSEIRDKLEFSLNIPKSDHYVLIIDNRKGNVKKSFVLKINASLDRPAVNAIKPAQTKKTEQINQQLDRLTDSLKRAFIFDDIHIQLSKCDKANAYSDSSKVYLCAEYINALAKSSKNTEATQKMLLFTLLHELGHVLLKKWDYPLTENEEAIDEFATVILIMFNQKAAAETQAEFFASVPAEPEIRQRLDKADRHPLSVQRGRNINRWLESPNLVLQWQPLLVPHMQTSFLEILSKKDLQWINHDLVQKELAYRNRK